MGLGLFIAKTLLERSGAELSFANGREENALETQNNKGLGAIVEVRWNRQDIDAIKNGSSEPLGENLRFEA